MELIKGRYITERDNLRFEITGEVAEKTVEVFHNGRSVCKIKDRMSLATALHRAKQIMLSRTAGAYYAHRRVGGWVIARDGADFTTEPMSTVKAIALLKFLNSEDFA